MPVPLFQDPYAEKAIALLQAPAEYRAKALQQIADAQSRAAIASGEAYGHAFDQTGQAIAGAFAQASDPNRRLANQQLSDLKALDNAFSKPGGRDDILNSLPGHLRGTVAKQFADADESAAKVREAQLKAEDATSDYVNNLAEGIKFHNYDPSAAQLAISHAKQTFASNPSLVQQVSQLEQLIQANPTADTVKAAIDPIMQAYEAKQKPVILPATPRGGAPAQLVRPGGEVVATGQAAPAQPLTPTQVELDAATLGKPNETPTAQQSADAVRLAHPTPVPSQEWKDVLLDGKPAKIFVDPKTKVVTTLSGTVVDNPDARIKPIPTSAQVTISSGALTDAALEQAAQQYLQTGKLPAGIGVAVIARNAKIMNRAAELEPNAGLALNQANYKAQSANLTNLQKTEGTLSAFETSAGKNLDQFMTLANKIPDTGVPWLNTPVRLLDAKVVGSENMAAINAARDVALREIARVTNDPKLSGSLTDTARREVSGLVPADATLPQIKAAVKVLRTDMANVHDGLTQQIASTKEALASHPSAPPVAAIPANVAAALKGIAPGVHTLSDGTKWLVAADGTITKQ